MSRGKRIRVVLALAAVVAGAGLLWANAVWPHVAPKNFGVAHVDAQRQIYRSGQLTVAATAKVVRRYGVRTIVDLGTHEPDSPGDRIAQKTAEALGVQRYRLELEGDATGDPNDYVAALRIMADPAAQPVLVHCGAGSERTGCVIALYRQIEQGWDADLAYQETKRYRHSSERNPRLRHVLEYYGDEIARAFAAGGEVAYEPEEFLKFEAAGTAPTTQAKREAADAGGDDVEIARTKAPESGEGADASADADAAGGM
jgi:protein tyrosine phosphatase (PTP) superfamily phosphohydrolase (DUF442 family)